MYVCKKKKLSDVLVKCNFIFCERKDFGRLRKTYHVPVVLWSIVGVVGTTWV
jgi:hypothetical protein